MLIPILDDIVAQGLAKLIEGRPTAARHVVDQSGNYFDPFAGWRAQLALLRRRIIDECRARRLPTATARALVELAQSEFLAELPQDPQAAVGQVILTRPNVARGAGVIREGTRFRIDADPSASPPVAAARFVSSEPVYVDATTTLPIPIVAPLAGPDANIPRYVGSDSPAIVIDDTLFDTTFEVSASDAAGGSSGVSDPDLRRFAQAFYTGQFAPTDGALVAGALSDAGVKHVALVRDNKLGQTVLFIADQSWAWSLAFQNTCKRVLKETWLGFGARVDVRPIVNRRVALRASVVLADPKFADTTAEIGASVRAAVRRYLDERADFYTFDPNALAGVVAACDSRVLTCTGATLVDLATGTELQPTTIAAQSPSLVHFYLTDNGLTLTSSLPT